MSNYKESEAIRSLIELAIELTGSRAAYVYEFDQQSGDATLIASTGPKGDSNTFSEPLTSLHRERKSPIVIEDGAWNDGRFSDLPEFRSCAFESVVSVPLVDSGSTIGLVNFGRDTSQITIRDLGVLLQLCVPLASVMAGRTPRQELVGNPGQGERDSGMIPNGVPG